MNNSQNVLLNYLKENKDRQGFDVDYKVFNGYPEKDVAAIFEELISIGVIEGFVNYQYIQPEIFIKKINWQHIQNGL